MFCKNPRRLFLRNLFFITLISFVTISSSSLWAKRPDVDEAYIESIKKEGWKEILVNDNIKVFKKEFPGSSFTAFRGIGILKVPMPILFHVVRDVEKSHLWTPNLTEKRIIQSYNYLEAVTYNLNALPWPATDRETVLYSKLYFDEKINMFNVFTKSVDHQLAPPSKKLVRGIVHDCNFYFKPVPEGTLVDLEAVIDPKGSIPAWIVNMLQKKWPALFLLKMEEYSLKNQFLPEPIFVKLYEDFIKKNPKNAYDGPKIVPATN
jgi:hypothetical protein